MGLLPAAGVRPGGAGTPGLKCQRLERVRCSILVARVGWWVTVHVLAAGGVVRDTSFPNWVSGVCLNNLLAGLKVSGRRPWVQAVVSDGQRVYAGIWREFVSADCL